MGLPFSDPLADGPVIHAAAVTALQAGAALADCLAIARSVATEVPVVVMGYVNPILARGVERFCDLLVEAGVCGLIVPDLPLEESGGLGAACADRGLALVPLVGGDGDGGRAPEGWGLLRVVDEHLFGACCLRRV